MRYSANIFVKASYWIVPTMFGMALIFSPMQTAASAESSPGKKNESVSKDQHLAFVLQTPVQGNFVEHQNSARNSEAESQIAATSKTEELNIQKRSAQASVAQAFFGFLGMVLLFFTLVYTARTANAAKRSADQVSVSLEHTIRAVDASVRSADAAEGSIAFARDQFLASRRPYMAITPIWGTAKNSTFVTSENFPLTADWVIFRGEIKNIGQTPAMDSVAHIDLVVTEMGAPPIWEHAALDAQAGTLIGPGQSVSTGWINLGQEQFDSIFQMITEAYVKITFHYKRIGSDDLYKSVSIFKLMLATDFAEAQTGNFAGLSSQPMPGGMMT